MDEDPGVLIGRRFKDNALVKYLEFKDITLRDVKKPTLLRKAREIINANGPAVCAILDSITTSHISLKNLEVLSLSKVEVDGKLINGVSLIIQGNFLKELLINDCNLGSSGIVVQKLANALSFNTSIRGLELNGNQLTDD